MSAGCFLLYGEFVCLLYGNVSPKRDVRMRGGERDAANNSEGGGGEERKGRVEMREERKKRRGEDKKIELEWKNTDSN